MKKVTVISVIMTGLVVLAEVSAVVNKTNPEWIAYVFAMIWLLIVFRKHLNFGSGMGSNPMLLPYANAAFFGKLDTESIIYRRSEQSSWPITAFALGMFLIHAVAIYVFLS